MQRSLVIARAEFGVFHAARLFTLVLRRRVIPHFADGTLEGNDVSHGLRFLKSNFFLCHCEENQTTEGSLIRRSNPVGDCFGALLRYRSEVLLAMTGIVPL